MTPDESEMQYGEFCKLLEKPLSKALPHHISSASSCRAVHDEVRALLFR